MTHLFGNFNKNLGIHYRQSQMNCIYLGFYTGIRRNWTESGKIKRFRPLFSAHLALDAGYRGNITTNLARNTAFQSYERKNSSLPTEQEPNPDHISGGNRGNPILGLRDRTHIAFYPGAGF